MRLLVLSALFATSHAHKCGISKPVDDQTTEGIAPLGKWPWQVYMRNTDGHARGFCGGTIIAERWILSAAHCFDDYLEDSEHLHVLIRTGVVNIKEAANDDFQYKNIYGVKKVFVHAKYNITTLKDDIALLELERPITFSTTISPICLAHVDQDVNIDQEAWLIGFGTFIDDETKELVDDISNVLREAVIPLARHSECEEAWDENVVDRIICAGSHGFGAGEGDSGGPLMTQSVEGPWYQVGIVSFGSPDSDIATNHTIGAYTSVGHYCDWIEKVTGGEAKCAEKEVEMKLLEENDGERKTTDDDEDEEKNKDDNDSDDEDDDKDDARRKRSLYELLTRAFFL